MADEADFAQESEEHRLATALANRTVYQGTSATECITCGDDIPLKRQEILPGVQTCVVCAERSTI